jgi:hypothetical protein
MCKNNLRVKSEVVLTICKKVGWCSPRRSEENGFSPFGLIRIGLTAPADGLHPKCADFGLI